MLALPAAPVAPRPRTLLIATTLSVAAGVMAFAGMLGFYLSDRNSAGGTTAAWLPKGVKIPEVPANLMLVTAVGASFMVQWAMYSVRNQDRRNTAIALAVTAIFGLAIVNAQAFVYGQMKVPIIPPSGSLQHFNSLFYAITGAFMAAVVIGLVMAAVTAFRAIGGRYSSRDTEGIAATAIYWHFLTAVYFAVWFVIYVNK